MRPRTVPAVLLAAMCLLIAPSAQAANKGGPTTPDLGIKKLESSTYIGLGVVAPDGSGETASRTVRQGHVGSFNVKLANTGSGTMNATMKGCRPDTGFMVRYFLGKTEISSSMKAGTLSITLAGNSSVVIRVDVTAGATTHVGRVESCPVDVLQSSTVVDRVIGAATVRS